MNTVHWKFSRVICFIVCTAVLLAAAGCSRDDIAILQGETKFDAIQSDAKDAPSSGAAFSELLACKDPASLPYVSIGDVFTIDFGKSELESATVFDYLLNEDGSQKYVGDVPEQHAEFTEDGKLELLFETRYDSIEEPQGTVPVAWNIHGFEIVLSEQEATTVAFIVFRTDPIIK